jgi:hypothetical protein
MNKKQLVRLRSNLPEEIIIESDESDIIKKIHELNLVDYHDAFFYERGKFENMGLNECDIFDYYIIRDALTIEQKESLTKLREQTGIGIMLAKKCLEENDWNYDNALRNFKNFHKPPVSYNIKDRIGSILDELRDVRNSLDQNDAYRYYYNQVCDRLDLLHSKLVHGLSKWEFDKNKDYYVDTLPNPVVHEKNKSLECLKQCKLGHDLSQSEFENRIDQIELIEEDQTIKSFNEKTRDYFEATCANPVVHQKIKSLEELKQWNLNPTKVLPICLEWFLDYFFEDLLMNGLQETAKVAYDEMVKFTMICENFNEFQAIDRTNSNLDAWTYRISTTWYFRLQEFYKKFNILK